MAVSPVGSTDRSDRRIDATCQIIECESYSVNEAVKHHIDASMAVEHLGHREALSGHVELLQRDQQLQQLGLLRLAPQLREEQCYSE